MFVFIHKIKKGIILALHLKIEMHVPKGFGQKESGLFREIGFVSWIDGKTNRIMHFPFYNHTKLMQVGYYLSLNT